MTMFQPAIGAHDLEGVVGKYQKQLNLEALAYLESRDVHEKTIAQFALGYEDHKIGFSVEQATVHLAGRIIFPIRDREGRVVDLIGRLLDDREPKYKSLLGAGPLLFNAPVLQEAEEVVLAGGMFDLLSLSQVPLSAVAVPDCYSFHKEQAECFADKRVFICYGNDDEGRRENERVANLLEDVAEEVYIVTLPEGIKDINDLFVRAENATEVFVSLINRAIQTIQASGIAPDSHYLTMYNEEYLKRHRGQTIGIPSGISELDDLLLGGFRPGLCVIKGAPDVKTTTLIRQLADHAAFLDCPVAFFTWKASAFELWAHSISRLLDCTARVLYELQQVVEELNCPLIVTATEERDSHSPLALDFEATTDVLLRVARSEATETGRSSIRLDVQKNRDGDTGTVQIPIDNQVALFKTERELERKAGQNGADITSA